MKLFISAVLVSFSAIAQGQFTARELFYSAAEAPAPAKPAAKSTVTVPKKKPATQTATKSAPVATPSVTAPVTTPAPSHDGARIIAAAAVTAPKPSEGAALGLRYTILKLSGGEMTEVAPDTVFHAGDRIQFAVETNGPGYLYIVSQGSSGAWKPMFPSADVADGSNRIDGFHSYAMPPKTRLVFDEQAGLEKIFIVFSRQPEPSLESTVYSLRESKMPVNAPAQPKTLLMASIDDKMVGHLRETYTRDLIVEKVDENTPGEKKEKAVYTVNPSGSQDSRVVADLRLVHQ